jgi:hypothetical protein
MKEITKSTLAKKTQHSWNENQNPVGQERNIMQRSCMHLSHMISDGSRTYMVSQK